MRDGPMFSIDQDPSWSWSKDERRMTHALDEPDDDQWRAQIASQASQGNRWPG